MKTVRIWLIKTNSLKTADENSENMADKNNSLKTADENSENMADKNKQLEDGQ